MKEPQLEKLYFLYYVVIIIYYVKCCDDYALKNAVFGSHAERGFEPEFLPYCGECVLTVDSYGDKKVNALLPWEIAGML